MIYSNPFYIKNNGNGYSLEERDAICMECHKVIGRQEKYDVFDQEFKFPQHEKEQYLYCPYCGHKFVK